MRNYRFGAKKFLILTSLLAGLSLTGCGVTQGSLQAITIQTNTSAPSIVETSTIPTDTTAPIIDAQDVTIPYGAFLRLVDAATITDDQDESPSLEIVSVINMDEKAEQNTATSKEDATLSTTGNTASTSTTTVEVAEANPGENSGINESSTGSTETAGAAVTSETTAESEPGYLFSMPGKYSVLLKGTDKSGNESTKTIIVTVIDKTAPVFEGLRENYEITDKDKIAPDYLEGAKAIDEIDGDVTASVRVDDSNVQYGKAGSYSITYTATDESGNKAAAAIPVTINDTTAPYFTVLTSALNLFVTDEKPNYASLVTAIDAVDGDVKDSLTVDDSSVKYKYPGEYTANFRVQDKSGNVAEKIVPISISAGWKTQEGKTFYYSPDDGHLNQNWSNINGKWYYFDPDDGHMVTGKQTINGKQYLLDGVDGHMVTGWQLIDGKYYYYSPDDGHMYHEWSNIGGKEYYFDQSDGHMYTGTHYIDGEEYNFGTSGAARKVVQERSTSSSESRSISSYAYIGNANSRKFHKSSCSSVRDMKDYNKVGFDSRSEAIDAGYEPCKRCHP